MFKYSIYSNNAEEIMYDNNEFVSLMYMKLYKFIHVHKFCNLNLALARITSHRILYCRTEAQGLRNKTRLT